MKPLTLTVLMYHYVRDPGDQAEGGTGIPGLSLAHFEAQLDQLLRQYIPVTWPDLRRYLLEDKPLPEKACLVTFDDGVRDHYLNVFPALRRRELSGLFFCLARQPAEGFILGHKLHFLLAHLGVDGLRTAVWARLSDKQRRIYQQAEAGYRLRYNELNVLKAILQRDLSEEVNGLLSQLFEAQIGSELELARDYYLTSDQIAEMSAGGMHFGGHTRTHPWFDWIDSAAQAVQIKASAEWLKNVEPGPWAFAYPYGGLSKYAPAHLQANRFAAAFTTQTHIEHTDPFFIGRIDGEELSTNLTPLAAATGY